jgi:hypothetical protein
MFVFTFLENKVWRLIRISLRSAMNIMVSIVKWMFFCILYKWNNNVWYFCIPDFLVICALYFLWSRHEGEPTVTVSIVDEKNVQKHSHKTVCDVFRFTMYDLDEGKRSNPDLISRLFAISLWITCPLQYFPNFLQVLISSTLLIISLLYPQRVNSPIHQMSWLDTLIQWKSRFPSHLHINESESHRMYIYYCS